MAESIDEFTAKKRKIQDEVDRSGGVYGREELQKYLDNDRHCSLLVQQEIANDIAARPINLILHAVDETKTSSDEPGGSSSSSILKAHVVVPSQEAIVKEVLEEKKRTLLEKYVM